MDIKKLDDVLTVLKTREKKRLVAAYANDDHTRKFVLATTSTSASSASFRKPTKTRLVLLLYR